MEGGVGRTMVEDQASHMMGEGVYLLAVLPADVDLPPRVLGEDLEHHPLSKVCSDAQGRQTHTLLSIGEGKRSSQHELGGWWVCPEPVRGGACGAGLGGRLTKVEVPVWVYDTLLLLLLGLLDRRLLLPRHLAAAPSPVPRHGPRHETPSFSSVLSSYLFTHSPLILKSLFPLTVSATPAKAIIWGRCCVRS